MIHIVGIGPGDKIYLTEDSIKAIKESDYIIGHKRHIESVKEYIENKKIRIYEKITNIPNIIKEYYSADSKYYSSILNDKGQYIDNRNFKTYIKKENPMENIVVLASGDPSLYSISNYLKKNMPGYNMVQHPGISAVNYLFNKVNLPMNDVYITSTHGRELNSSLLLFCEKTFFFTDKEKGPYYLANYYLKNNKNPKMIIGENLSYEDEKITILNAKDIKKEMEFEMSVVIVLL